MTEWVVLWKPPGYRPVAETGIKTLCDGDSEPALLAMRSEALIIKQVDHQSEWSK